MVYSISRYEKINQYKIERVIDVKVIIKGKSSLNTNYVIPGLAIDFDLELANKYKPIVYSHMCASGTPKAIYYRIVIQKDLQNINKKCIQYFFYWDRQDCIFSTHNYDYEPIFIYINDKNNDNLLPYLVVNDGFADPECGFHKIEIRPSTGERSQVETFYSKKMSPAPYYPFGKDGNIECKGCSKNYPLSNKSDLKFRELHPVFGIRACSNVFSGNEHDLKGGIYDPPLINLDDIVLNDWYFNHFTQEDDMPFGHDIANPFSYPYIKYRCAREELSKSGNNS
jgi:hypothetical protein